MHQIITSAQNPTVKHLRQLASSSKVRREHNTYLSEGVHLVQSLNSSNQAPHSYVCAESALKNPEIASLIKGDAPVTVVSDSLFDSFASIHASVGIIALFSPKTPDTPATVSSSAVLLEDIQDPGNLGTILRTAVATGVTEAFLSPGCASPWSQKALRAGMGAQFGITLYESVDLNSLISAATIPVAATTLSTKSISLYEVDFTNPVAWLFGNEGQGVSEQLLSQTDLHVLIPQESTPVESLNVAAAAAVCLYEQYRHTLLV